jgi:hypothetical protein
MSPEISNQSSWSSFCGWLQPSSEDSMSTD